ncbi:RimK family alpha-L-glutamate ligase [Endozoicomonas gorgoniicola]|uniref:RimK family alpha-L-glutamate ligase n=1 Tax=Endozoicomonas gorgoniicola TaxID=1234144 RepID=A0ABT3MRE8_9GAMM|nr:RimK family alpha-L-glutamate ligase [Endozoicomonas gorgoniicola]MCW7551935.1 RimK family alpha-L-glutamate ligase [Endozoicomonas gorgoniicola]
MVTTKLDFAAQSIQRIREEAKHLGIEVDFVKPSDLQFQVKEGTLYFGNNELSRDLPDVFYCKTGSSTVTSHTLSCMQALELFSDTRVLNSYRCFEKSMDKFTTYLFLQKNGVPTPATVLLNGQVDSSRIADELGWPLVFKETRSARGQSVVFVDNQHQLDELIGLYNSVSREGARALVQRCCTKSLGKDIRVFVLGGKAFTAVERDAGGKSRRANISLGASVRAIDIDSQMSKIVEQTCQALDFSLGGVDLLYGDEGYEVSEVNLAARFDRIEKPTGHNLARETLLFLSQST